MIHIPEAYELMDVLAPLASKARVESAYWITTPDGEYLSNNGNEWCFDCGTAMVKHLRKRDRKHAEDYMLDGGWTCEHDTSPACAHCRVTLRASLTFNGGIYELNHFRDNPPDLTSIDQAYEVSEMLSGLSYVREDHVGIAQEAVTIVRSAVARRKTECMG